MAFRENVKHYTREINESDIPAAEMELNAFHQIDGILDEYSKITREYVVLQSTLSFEYDGDYEEYSDANRLLKEIGEFIEDQSFMDDEISVESIKKLIVYLQLQIGSKVSFYRTFEQMKKSKLLELKYSLLKKMGLYNFESLYSLFYKELVRELDIDIQNKSRIYDNYLNDELKLVSKNIEKITFEMPDEFLSYLDIVAEIKRVMSGADSEDDILFCRKLLAYLESKTNMVINDKEILQLMVQLGETKIFEKPKISSVDELKEAFNYGRRNGR